MKKGHPKSAPKLRYGEQAISEARLEPWANPSTDRNYTIDISCPEFSCLCPRSGYPDYATIRIHYIPKALIVELRSLKLYLNQFRNRYISHEASVNQVYDDLRRLLKPRWIEVVGDWNPRGNVKTIIRVASGEKPKEE